MVDVFGKSVEDGLKLSKRIYFGKDRAVSPPKQVAMEKAPHSYLPTAPMVYAEIFDPSMVDNPDIPSYQPHVHGRCDPPALIPLQMNGIVLEAECYLDTMIVTVTGSWRVHCVMGSRSCDCRLAIPMSDQAFKKEVVFVVDISGSMKGRPLENVKNGLCAALSKLNPEDSFNIIAFNGETYLFSSSLELATKETIENASQWISINFIAGGGTNILLPLNQAMEMLSNTRDSIPLIFLITDGSVEDERHICDVMKSNLTNRGSMAPRIFSFGIGSYCNHYFLQMLALISRGHYDAAYDADSIDLHMQRLFTAASTTIVANITIDTLECLDAHEVYPFHIPDLSSGSPLIVSGRYQGNFPDSLKAKGMLGDMNNFVIDLKVQKGKDIPLDKVVAKRQIDVLTAQAWLMEDKAIEEKVAKMSIQTSVPSEYTHWFLLQTNKGKQASESSGIQQVSNKIDLQRLVDSKGCKVILLRSLSMGFGDLNATAENIPPGSVEGDLSETADMLVKAASNCCGKLANCCCCMCCIKTCSRMNDQCAIFLTQLCTVLSCFGCISCCSDVCCPSGDG
ncbi:inter alpha-trypsin inhibitor, heavy chain 4-like [Macadamia integrifolia]|uniref:inter alpha-trypsin inhibitor, heavy chain 4-like n=1 Tax=Macadamia integrifolia TaxID=60698 RepID=UPI001C4E3296|nr:inter alpha-trypsin inhibitor, heavy chain 4-like [Macadamia integrifolia]